MTVAARVAARAAVLEIGLEVDAGAAAVAEAGLAIERAQPAGAHLAHRADLAARPAVGVVGLHVDAHAAAVGEAGLAGERAGAEWPSVAGTSNVGVTNAASNGRATRVECPLISPGLDDGYCENDRDCGPAMMFIADSHASDESAKAENERTREH